MSRLGTKTCKKSECKSSIQFDLLADKGNKPSTAKVSVAAVHRWGMTSFTSLRKTHLNGQKDISSENDDHRVKRVKVEPKTTYANAEDPFSFESDIESSSLKHSFSSHTGSSVSRRAPFMVDVKPAVPKPNKFFKSSSTRFLVSGQRKNDFDTLRLSVSTNHCNRVKSDNVIHRLNQYSPQSNFTLQMDNNSAVPFKSATSPDTAHLEQCSVNTSSTCASKDFFPSSDSDFYRCSSPSNICNVNSPTNMFKENIRTAPSHERQCSPLSITTDEILSVHKTLANLNSSDSGYTPDAYRTSENKSCINSTTGYNTRTSDVNDITKEGRDLIDFLEESGLPSQGHDLIDTFDESLNPRLKTQRHIRVVRRGWIDMIDDEEKETKSDLPPQDLIDSLDDSLSPRVEEHRHIRAVRRGWIDMIKDEEKEKQRKVDLLSQGSDLINALDDESLNPRVEEQSHLHENRREWISEGSLDPHVDEHLIHEGRRDILDVMDDENLDVRVDDRRRNLIDMIDDASLDQRVEVSVQERSRNLRSFDNQRDVQHHINSKQEHLMCMVGDGNMASNFVEDSNFRERQKDFIDLIDAENRTGFVLIEDKREFQGNIRDNAKDECVDVKECRVKSFLDSETVHTVQSTHKPIDSAEIKHLKKSFTYPLDSQQTSTAKDKDWPSQQLKRTKKIFSSSKKNKAVYNHRHWQATKDAEQLSEKEPERIDNFSDMFDCELFREEPSQFSLVKRINSSKAVKEVAVEEKSSVARDERLVIRNVKQAYQCHESGETQEFNDDIEYLLECIQEPNVIGTRCLSVLSLATKCMGPAFRVHLRAHGTMPKIFSALQDAPSDPNLSLCTATLLFVLSQDRLSMDLDGNTLSLMLKLLESDPGVGSKERELELILEDPALCAMQEKHMEKVYQLCEQMQQKGHAKHLKLDNINTGILAMETLLSLTSRRTGEWFKEGIRTLHGLDHIVDTVTTCVSQLAPEEAEIISNPSDTQLDKIRKIDRCFRVLENVSFMNVDNQVYLLKFRDSSLIELSLSLLKVFEPHLMANAASVIMDSNPDDGNETYTKTESPVLSCLLSLLKVLLNITHENQFGSSKVGSTEGLIGHVLKCILQLPRAVPPDKRFDILVLSLGILINLVEHSFENAKQIVDMYVPGSFDTINDGYEMPALEALIEVLLSRLEAARQSEEQADALLSSQEEKNIAAAVVQKDATDNGTSQADDLEETLMKTLQKAKKHMEHSIIAAYISLLLGCIIENNKDYADIIKDHLPDGKLDVMVDVLQKFHSFVSLTNVVGNTGLQSLERVIEVLQSS